MINNSNRGSRRNSYSAFSELDRLEVVDDDRHDVATIVNF